MAETGLQYQTLSCSICLNLLEDPVTLSCGHSYCMKCINSRWDEEDQKHLYSCPQCRQTFKPRPVLNTNTIIADLVEELKKTELQAAPDDLCYAGPEDVACDVCTGRKLKALKFCLRCLVSYCAKHLQPHNKVNQLKKHKLVEPSKKFQENVCPQHNEAMKMFCRTDKQCICLVCCIDEHKGHDMVPAATERMERQKELELSRQHIQQKVQEQEKDVKLLQKKLEDLNHSADEALKSSKNIFSEIIHLIQKRLQDVEDQVRSQQQTEVGHVKELQQKLEQELTQLKRKEAELEQLSHTQDHTQFLLSCPPLATFTVSTYSSRIYVRPLKNFEELTAAMSKLRDGLQDLLRDKWTNISVAADEVSLLPPQPEPRTRDEFLKYSCKLTLDPNTMNRYLILSEGNRRATFTYERQSYHDHPDRFAGLYPQVLSRESLTGRRYWEVERSGTRVYIAVAYTTNSRSGDVKQCGFGANDKSWSLDCDTDSYEFYHNNIATFISGPQSSRLGVYLDHGAGVLSFYSVSETMNLLHRVQTTFSQPLKAGLGVWCEASAEFCDLTQSFRVRRVKS